MPLISDIGNADVLGEVQVEWNAGDLFSLSDKVDDSYNSPVFSFDGAQWYICMYPNGQTIYSSSGWVSLFLHRKDSGPAKIAYFSLGIKGSDGVELVKYNRTGDVERAPSEIKYEFPTETAGSGYDFTKAWSRSDLRNRKSVLLPKNVLIFTCDLRSNAKSSFTGEKKLLKSLRNVLESGDDSDVVLKVQGKKFPAHKVILRARSPVFRSMFQHDMVEKQSNVVTIQDCDNEAFHDFLVHIYSGSCEHISTKNVFSLFTAADKYDIGELKSACADFTKRNISVACFYDFIALAIKYNEKELIESATKFFCSNSLEIVKTAEWQTFLKDNLTVGNELIIKALSK